MIDLLFLSGYDTHAFLSLIQGLEEEIESDMSKVTTFILIVSDILFRMSQKYRECARANWKTIQSEQCEAMMDNDGEDDTEDYMKQSLDQKRKAEYEQVFIHNLLTRGFFSKYLNLTKWVLQCSEELPISMTRAIMSLCGRYMVLSESVASDLLPLVVTLSAKHADNIVALNALVLLSDMQYVLPSKSEQHLDQLFNSLKPCCSPLLRYTSMALIGDLFLHKIIKNENGLSKMIERVADNEHLLLEAQLLLQRILFNDSKRAPQLLYNMIISCSDCSHCAHYDVICDTLSQMVETVCQSIGRVNVKEMSRFIVRCFIDKPSILSATCLTKLDPSAVELTSIEHLKTFIDLNSFDLFNQMKKEATEADDSDHSKALYQLMMSFLRKLKAQSTYAILSDEMIQALSNTYSTLCSSTINSHPSARFVRRNKNAKRVKLTVDDDDGDGDNDYEGNHDGDEDSPKRLKTKKSIRSKRSHSTTTVELLSKHIEQFKNDA